MNIEWCKKIFLINIVLLSLVFSRNYPLYKQCDPKWAQERLGTSSNTICGAGCLMSSAAMALKGTGHDFNPSTLNRWLTSHGGYASGDSFIWASIDKLGVKFQGKVGNSQIKAKLDKGDIVICNVHIYIYLRHIKKTVKIFKKN